MAEQTMKDLKKDIYLMLHKSLEMMELIEDGFVKSKVSALDQAEDLAKDIQVREDRLTETLSKLAAANSEARGILGVPGHIEKIAYNLRRLNDGIRTKNKEALLFSDKAMQETGTLFAKAKEILKNASDAAVTSNTAAADKVKSEAEALVGLADGFATAHEDRLVAGECSPKTSSTYLCILYSFEDVVSHAKEVVKKLTAK